MIAALAKEQADDDSKKDFCTAELAKAEDAVKALKGEISDLDADISEREDAIATVASEIEALQAGIAELDKTVAQATEQRKEEHEEYAATAASNQAALELIGMAMMDEMIRDVEMDIQSAKHDEEDAQKDYEETMQDAATKRSEDSKLIVEKEGAKADQTSNLEATRETRMTKQDQKYIAEDKLNDLHKDCDYLLANYDQKKADRATESDGLKEAKAVLAGAAPGFLQKRA